MQKGIKNAKQELNRLESKHPEYPTQYEEITKKEKENLGLPENATTYRPSIQRAENAKF